MRSCRDVTTALASDALDGASWRERLAVRMHLVFCRHCRRYAAQLRAIGDAARRLAAARAAATPAETLDRLRGRILGDSGEGPRR